MSWSRGGDTAATYPPLLSVMDDPAADDRLLNEMAGFLWRLSTLSAAHLTDYVVNRGTVHMIGTGRAGELTRIAVERAVPVGRKRGWKPFLAVTQWSLVKR